MKRSLLLCAVVVSCAVGCSETATITRNGYPFEATIVDGDATSVYVRTGDGAKSIPRSEITSITHPGHGYMTWGAIGVGLGAAELALTSQTSGDRTWGYLGGGALAVLGLSTAIDGIRLYSRSVHALHTEHAPSVLPTVAPVQGGAVAGAVVRF